MARTLTFTILALSDSGLDFQQLPLGQVAKRFSCEERGMALDRAGYDVVAGSDPWSLLS